MLLSATILLILSVKVEKKNMLQEGEAEAMHVFLLIGVSYFFLCFFFSISATRSTKIFGSFQREVYHSQGTRTTH